MAVPPDPLARHQAQTDEALATGDAATIKRLYVELGRLLEEGHGDDLDSVPLLSRPELLPVVVGMLQGVTGRVLDAGCGPRPDVSIAAARGAQAVVALDIGLGTVRLARAVAADKGASVLGVVGDVEALPFRAGAFDGVVCDDTVEHLPDDHRGVSELARVLARHGRLVLSTPNRRSALVVRQKVVDRMRGRRRPPAAYYAATSHLREYTWREAERLVGTALRVRRRAGVGWADGGRRRRLLSLMVMLPGGRRAGQLIVIEAEHRPTVTP